MFLHVLYIFIMEVSAVALLKASKQIWLLLDLIAAEDNEINGFQMDGRAAALWELAKAFNQFEEAFLQYWEEVHNCMLQGLEALYNQVIFWILSSKRKDV